MVLISTGNVLSFCLWRLFTQPLVQVQIKENIKVPRHWPLCEEFTGDRWIPHTKRPVTRKCFHLMTSLCCQMRPCKYHILLCDDCRALSCQFAFSIGHSTGIPGFATDCCCGVWCRGLTTCFLYSTFQKPNFKQQFACKFGESSHVITSSCRFKILTITSRLSSPGNSGLMVIVWDTVTRGR